MRTGLRRATDYQTSVDESPEKHLLRLYAKGRIKIKRKEMSNKTLPFLSYLSLVVRTERENQCKKKGDKRVDGKEGDEG